jgi:hypothetical protein
MNTIRTSSRLKRPAIRNHAVVIALSGVVFAACAHMRPAPEPRERYAADGAVSGEVVERSDADRFENSAGASYRGSEPLPGNAQPEYPPGLLSRMLPPATVEAQIVIDGGGVVEKVRRGGIPAPTRRSPTR